MRIVLTNKLAGTVFETMIPAFLIPPDVIIWGSRFFHRDMTSRTGVGGGLEYQYVESFAYALVS